MLEASRHAARDTRVLILDDAADNLIATIRDDFPTVTFIPCASYELVAPLTERHRPQVALTYRLRPGPYPRAPLVESGILSWVHIGGAGVDHLQPWRPDEVTITNSSGIHGDIIAQYVAGAMLAFNQNMSFYAMQRERRAWSQEHSRSLAGQTVTVVGFGRIGEEIGRVCKFFGMHVIGVRNNQFESDFADRGVGLVDLGQAMSEAHHVVVCLPLTERTHGILDATCLAQVRPGAHLINVARGGIVDEAALIPLLNEGTIAHATIDVFSQEPLPPTSPLWTHRRITLTPHISSNVGDWKMRVLSLFTDNLKRWLGGRELKNVVFPDRGY